MMAVASGWAVAFGRLARFGCRAMTMCRERVRELNISRTCALLGGVMFGFNGTAAWTPYGPERLVASATLHSSYGADPLRSPGS
jgi:hypothetical protein